MRLGTVLFSAFILAIVFFALNRFLNKGSETVSLSNQSGAPPQISTPAATPQRISPDYGKLPKDASGLLPTQEGGRFLIQFEGKPTKGMNLRIAFDSAVAPVLEAIGFAEGKRRLISPNEDGIRLGSDGSKWLETGCDNFRKLSNSLRADYPQLNEACEAVMRRDHQPMEQLLKKIGEESEFVAELLNIKEYDEREYFFAQVHDGTVIEGVGVFAVAPDGQGVSTVTGRLIDKFKISNKVVLTKQQAFEKAENAIQGIPDTCCYRTQNKPEVELMLLPYGSQAGVHSLKYAYRLSLDSGWMGAQGLYYAWVDAETGTLLRLVPMFASVQAEGMTYTRSPEKNAQGTIETMVRSFEIDPPQNNLYRLKYFGPPALWQEVRDLRDGTGFTHTSANMNVAPINQINDEFCRPGGGASLSSGFERVNFFARLSEYGRKVKGAATTEFSVQPVALEYNDNSQLRCNQVAFAGFTGNRITGFPRITMGSCPGYDHGSCPDISSNSFLDGRLNSVHDNTIIAHEFAHVFVPHYQTGRRIDWCFGSVTKPAPLDGMGEVSCPTGPVLLNSFHDFADAFANHFEDTPCTGSWFMRNRGPDVVGQTAESIPGASADCKANDQFAAGLPRLSSVRVPADPTDEHNDRFPDHIALGANQYSDMQVASTALWHIRAGHKNVRILVGDLFYFRGLARVLRRFGWYTEVGDNHRTTYNGLVELESRFLALPNRSLRRRRNGKIVSSFARVGIFPIHADCLDGQPNTAHPIQCPSGESSRASVIDLIDPSPNPVLVEAAGFDETLNLGSPQMPRFHVWTGPTYQFDNATNTAKHLQNANCGDEFKVEFSNNPNFNGGAVVASDWVSVDTTNANPLSQCYKDWDFASLPNAAAEWAKINGRRFFCYRVTTRKNGKDPLVSTESPMFFGSRKPILNCTYMTASGMPIP